MNRRRQRTSAAKRRAYCKWEARRLLTENGNLLTLIGACLVTAAFSEALVYGYETLIACLCPRMTPALAVAEMVLLFAVVSPAALGVAWLAWRMAHGETARLSDCLWVYENPVRLCTSYGVSLIVMAAVLLVVGLSRYGATWLAVWRGHDVSVMVLGVRIAVYRTLFACGIGCVLTVLLLPVVLLPMAFMAADGGSLTETWRILRRAVRGHRRELLGMVVSFLGLLVLSALTCGLLFVVYAGPFMLLTLAVLATYFTEASEP